LCAAIQTPLLLLLLLLMLAVLAVQLPADLAGLQRVLQGQ
jgi:hypothetical protein